MAASIIDPAALVAMIQQIQRDVSEMKQCLAGASKSHYTVDEIARVVGRSSYTVRRWIAEQRIRATRIDGTGPRGRLLIAREELSRLIADGLGAEVPATTIDSRA